MYTHLTQEERYHIYELRAMGKSMRQAAKELKSDQQRSREKSGAIKVREGTGQARLTA